MAGTVRVDTVPQPQIVAKQLQVSPALDGAELVGLVLAERYELCKVVGAGGMGTVYEARHRALGRRFAVKVLRREISHDASAVARFFQEARVTAGLRHENLVDVLDFGHIDAAVLPSLGTLRLPFFVMEFLEGETLGDRLRRSGPLDVADARVLFVQVAAGLAAAHDQAIVHRDLKPDNVFLATVGRTEVVKLLDFGVARVLASEKLTRVGTVFGTPYYMSPEQAAGSEVDVRSDQYALGVLMYEALSGRVPFDSDTHMGVLTKHVFAVPEPVLQVAADPEQLGDFADVVMRCLEKRPEARYRSCRELAEAIGGGLSAGTPADQAPTRQVQALRLRELPASQPAPSPLAQAPTHSRDLPEIPAAPRTWLIALAGALTLGAIVLGVVSWRTSGAADVQPPRTGPEASGPEASGPEASGPEASGGPLQPSAGAPERLTSPEPVASPGPPTAPQAVPSAGPPAAAGGTQRALPSTPATAPQPSAQAAQSATPSAPAAPKARAGDDVDKGVW